MKRTFGVLLVVAFMIGILLQIPGVMAPPVPATTCVATDTQICVGNLPAGGVTGGTTPGFCSSTPGEEDEWHFVINQLDPTANAPLSITVTFQTAGAKVINLEKVTGNTAHYRIEALYLTDTLLNACAILPTGTCYGNFNLSHAPCGTTTTTTTTTETTITAPPEVGGDIYPVNKVGLLIPWIASAVVIVVGTALLIWHRRTQS